MIKSIITTSWDDGYPTDLKLAELLNRYNVPATFYVPIVNNERRCMNHRQIREVAQRYEVGSHSYHHLELTRIPPGTAEIEIIKGKQNLEDIIGREVFSFCYPWGSFNNTIVSIVKRAGFTGARTARILTVSVSDPFKTGTTFQAADWHLIPYIRQSVYSRDFKLFGFMLRKNLLFKAWDRIAIESLNFVVKNGGVWHLWGHSWEVNANNDWGRLENVLRKVGELSHEVERMNSSQLSTYIRTVKRNSRNENINAV